jgi:hypothetical protein
VLLNRIGRNGCDPDLWEHGRKLPSLFSIEIAAISKLWFRFQNNPLLVVTLKRLLLKWKNMKLISVILNKENYFVMGLYALFKKLKLAFKIFLVHLPMSKYWRH